MKKLDRLISKKVKKFFPKEASNVNKDINHMSDIDLAFEYRELRENLGWEKDRGRYNDVEREIVKRELARRHKMEGLSNDNITAFTGSYPGKKTAPEKKPSAMTYAEGREGESFSNSTKPTSKKPLVGRKMALQVLKILKPNIRPDLNEFVMGINDELGEHAGTIHKFAQPGYDELEAAGLIALDHLAENPRWYSEAKRSGL